MVKPFKPDMDTIEEGCEGHVIALMPEKRFCWFSCENREGETDTFCHSTKLTPYHISQLALGMCVTYTRAKTIGMLNAYMCLKLEEITLE